MECGSVTPFFLLLMGVGVLFAPVEAHGTSSRRASVGTFNALLNRGAVSFQERKDTLLETVSSKSTNQYSHLHDASCSQDS